MVAIGMQPNAMLKLGIDSRDGFIVIGVGPRIPDPDNPRGAFAVSLDPSQADSVARQLRRLARKVRGRKGWWPW